MTEGDRQPELARHKSGKTSDKDQYLFSYEKATSQSPSQPKILFLPYRPVFQIRFDPSLPTRHPVMRWFTMAEHESPRLRLPRARNANPLIVERFNLPDP
jgi:hypothetical protein